MVFVKTSESKKSVNVTTRTMWHLAKYLLLISGSLLREAESSSESGLIGHVGGSCVKKNTHTILTPRRRICHTVRRTPVWYTC